VLEDEVMWGILVSRLKLVGNRGVGNLRLIGLVGLGPASRVFTCSLLDRLLTASTPYTKMPHMTSYSNTKQLLLLHYIHTLLCRSIYIYYIHPELRIGNCRFRSGKGAEGAAREQGGAAREQGGARGSRGEQRGSKKV
jgi:hypothetical protein